MIKIGDLVQHINTKVQNRFIGFIEAIDSDNLCVVVHWIETGLKSTHNIYKLKLATTNANVVK